MCVHRVNADSPCVVTNSHGRVRARNTAAARNRGGKRLVLCRVCETNGNCSSTARVPFRAQPDQCNTCDNVQIGDLPATPSNLSAREDTLEVRKR